MNWIRLFHIDSSFAPQGAVRQIYEYYHLDGQHSCQDLFGGYTSMKKKRLDVLLFEKGMVPSRERAKAIIMSGYRLCK